MRVEPMSVVERLQFGLIAAVFGAGIGSMANLFLGPLAMFFLGHQRLFNWWVIWFSVIFFFAAGMVRGPKVADTVAESYVALLMVVLVALTIGGGGGAVGGDDQAVRWKTSFLWAIAYFAGLVVITWLG
jgi:hypothetical protein